MFFQIWHNSFDNVGFPWGAKISGPMNHYHCSTCGVDIKHPQGDVNILLEKRKGCKWPDILGDGSMSLFTVSLRVLADWQREGIGPFPVHRAIIKEPYPQKLEGIHPPDYFWLDGKQMLGAKVDFEASGFVDVKFCPECGNRTDNISETDKRQGTKKYGTIFFAETWNGADLFTTDISDRHFFCTEKIVECAAKYKHSNFRFIPVEWGDPVTGKGLPYWDKHFSLSKLEQYKNITDS